MTISLSPPISSCLREGRRMAQPASREPILPETWTAVLDTIQDTLSRTIAATTERERTMDLAGPPPAPAAMSANTDVAGIANLVSRTEQQTGEVDAVLADAEKSLLRWLREIREVGQTLAKGGTVGIG